MGIGETIRKYRKAVGLTQEEMSRRLGVTPPAVNKWENGHTQPDIMLLAPIARLLQITPDTLLSFHEELSVETINDKIDILQHKLEGEDYQVAFTWGKKQIEEYPNCEQLIWQIALVLDTWRLTTEVKNSEQYDDGILGYYSRLLESNNPDIKYAGADALFNVYIRKKEYQVAEKYLDYLTKDDPKRKRKQAMLYSKTKQVSKAYQAYEELLFSDYQNANMTLHNLYQLALEEGNQEIASLFVEKQQTLAKVFEMGLYHELSAGLDLAILEKNVEETLKIFNGMLFNLQSIMGFMESKLYSHMKFSPISEESLEKISKDLLKLLQDQATFSYMEGNQAWKQLIEKTN